MAKRKAVLSIPILEAEVVIEEEEVYEVQEILKIKKQGKYLMYQVRWRGFDDKHDQWIAHNDTKELQEAIYDFYTNQGVQTYSIACENEVPGNLEYHTPHQILQIEINGELGNQTVRYYVNWYMQEYPKVLPLPSMVDGVELCKKYPDLVQIYMDKACQERLGKSLQSIYDEGILQEQEEGQQLNENNQIFI